MMALIAQKLIPMSNESHNLNFNWYFFLAWKKKYRFSKKRIDSMFQLFEAVLPTNKDVDDQKKSQK